MEESPLKPLGNSIYNNLSIGKGGFNFEDVVVEGGIRMTPNLQDENITPDVDYQFSADSEVFNKLDGFENIDFDKIGVKN